MADERGGVWYALLAAILFGASAPLAKLLLHGAPPQLLAGLLYLGSGLGLSIVDAVRSRTYTNTRSWRTATRMCTTHITSTSTQSVIRLVSRIPTRMCMLRSRIRIRTIRTFIIGTATTKSARPERMTYDLHRHVV